MTFSPTRLILLTPIVFFWFLGHIGFLYVHHLPWQLVGGFEESRFVGDEDADLEMDRVTAAA